MRADDLNQRLSKISTVWPVLQQAHEGTPEQATAAQQLLLERYGRAVHAYLLGAVRDRDLAEELTQEFALGLIRGEFRHADPQRGRFRNYVKTALFHLMSRHRKRQQKQPLLLPGDSPELEAVSAPEEDGNAEFNTCWRDERLARTWDALADAQPTFHAVLRFRAQHPDLHASDMAQQLSGQLGKPLTAEGIRQTLRRAREKFADLLLEEVARSLRSPTAEEVEAELEELNLLEYCRPALERYSGGR